MPVASSIPDLHRLAQDRLLPALISARKLSKGKVEVGVSDYTYKNEFEAFIRSEPFIQLAELLGQKTGIKPDLDNAKHEYYALPHHLLSARGQNAEGILEGSILGRFEDNTYLVGPIVVGEVPQRKRTGPSFKDESSASTLIIQGTIAVDGDVLLTALDVRPKVVLNKHLMEIMEKVLPSECLQ